MNKFKAQYKCTPFFSIVFINYFMLCPNLKTNLFNNGVYKIEIKIQFLVDLNSRWMFLTKCHPAAETPTRAMLAYPKFHRGSLSECQRNINTQINFLSLIDKDLRCIFNSCCEML